jgi:EmrB/QacA subfamily drug resistance transporter
MFAIVSIALLMASIDQTIVATALPAVQHDLDAKINWVGWTITIYALGQIVAMPFAGKLSDDYGRKRVFVGSIIVFTAASLCCSLSQNVYVLVFFRAIQALGGGAFMPSATGIVSDHYGPDRDRALGMFASIFPIGAIVGPILGGFFVTYWSWRGIFLVNVPIGIILIALSARYIPTSQPRTQTRIDLVGAGVLAATLLVGMYAISSLGGTDGGIAWTHTVVSTVAAFLLGAIFVVRAERVDSPVIPARLLHGKGFGTMNLLNFLYGGAAMGFGALVPLYAQERYGIRALEAGTLLTARGIGTICCAGLAVWALRRTGYRKPMIAGYLTLATGMTGMAFVPDAPSTYFWLSVAAGVSGLGMGMAIPAANNANLQLAPDQVSAIAGMRGMFRQTGSIVAISASTAVLAHGNNDGFVQAEIFVVFSLMLIAAIPLVLLVPDHRGAW